MTLIQLTDLLREMEPNETLGSEDAGVFVLLFEGSLMEPVTLALDDTDQTLDEEEMQALAMAEAGVILYQDEHGDWGLEFFEDTDDLEERWLDWESEARAAYGEAIGLDEEDGL